MKETFVRVNGHFLSHLDIMMNSLNWFSEALDLYNLTGIADNATTTQLAKEYAASLQQTIDAGQSLYDALCEEIDIEEIQQSNNHLN